LLSRGFTFSLTKLIFELFNSIGELLVGRSISAQAVTAEAGSQGRPSNRVMSGIDHAITVFSVSDYLADSSQRPSGHPTQSLDRQSEETLWQPAS